MGDAVITFHQEVTEKYMSLPIPKSQGHGLVWGPCLVLKKSVLWHLPLFSFFKNKNRLSPWETVFSGGGRMPKTHQQKLTVGTELAGALEHSQLCPLPPPRLLQGERGGGIMVIICYHQVITYNYQLLLLTFHILKALIMCQALCQPLYISILICSREQPQAVG